MSNNLHDGIQYLMNATNLNELRQIFERLMCKYGFDLFALQFTPNSYKKMDLKPLAIANYEKEWVDYYFLENYHLIDPVIHIGKKQKKTFLWSDTWQGIGLTKKQTQLFNEANDYGVASGIGIPILSPYHSDGMVSLVSSAIKNDKELTEIIEGNNAEIHLLSVYFQQMAHYLIVRDNVTIHSVPLSEREKDCLKWAASGKTNSEIGQILGISIKTVEVHFSNCFRKLNAVSREQAVAKAIITKTIEF